MKFITPELVTTRTRVLDYFAAQKQLIKCVPAATAQRVVTVH